MLLIREKQQESLVQASAAAFEDRMLQHIRKHFPSHYEALGEANCLDLIRFGIERGAKHAFISERHVCKYIDLMLCFGVEFDTDPKQTWAAPILTDSSWVSASAKMDALFQAGVKQLQ